MHIRPPVAGLAVAVLTVACSTTVNAPAPTPRHYEVYASPSEFHWTLPYHQSLPLQGGLTHLGGADATFDFDLGDVDTVSYIAIAANTVEERHYRSGEDRHEEPADVWVDAVQNLQTGRYFGSDADGSNLGHSVKLHRVYDVLDTLTGSLGIEESIDNLVGPPDGKYVAFGSYESSFIAIDSFLGEVVIENLMVNGDGPDVRVYARPAPIAASARTGVAARPASSRVKSVQSSAFAE